MQLSDHVGQSNLLSGDSSFSLGVSLSGQPVGKVSLGFLRRTKFSIEPESEYQRRGGYRLQPGSHLHL